MAKSVSTSEYRSWSVTSAALVPYQTEQSLLNTGLFRPRSYVNVRDPGGEKTYYVTDDATTLWDVTDNAPSKSINVSELVGRKILVTPTPMSRVTAIKAIAGQIASHAKVSIDSIQKNDYVRISAGGDLMNEIRQSALKVHSREHRAYHDAINTFQVAKIKSISSIDFETEFVKKADLSIRHIVSAGRSTLQDIRFLAKAGQEDKLTHLSDFGYMRSRAVEFFDLEHVKAWTGGGGGNVPNLQDLNTTGAKQVYAFYDAVRERHNYVIQKQIDRVGQDTRYAESKRSGMVQALQKKKVDMPFMDQFANRTISDVQEQFGREAGKMRNTVRSVIQSAEKHYRESDLTMRIREDGTYAIPDQGYEVAKVFENLSSMAQRHDVDNKVTLPLKEQKSPVFTQVKSVRLSRNPILNLASDILGNNANVGSFSSMESDLFDIAVKEIDIKLAKGGLDPALANSLRLERSVYTKANQRVVDVRIASQSILQDKINRITYISRQSTTEIADVLKSMGIHDGLIDKVTRGVHDDLMSNFRSGTSLEMIREALAAKDLASTAHTGAADAADLNELVQWLQDGIEQRKKAISYGGKRTDAANGMLYKIEKGDNFEYRFTEAAIKRIHSSQAANIITQSMSHEELGKVFGNTVLGSSVHDQSTQLGLHNLDQKVLQKNISRKIVDGLHARENLSIEAQSKMERFEVKEPGLLARAVSRGLIGRMIALKAAAYVDNFLAPGEPIDHGEHASLETVARKIAGTDFGSPVSKTMLHTFTSVLDKASKQWRGRAAKTLSSGSIRERSLAYLMGGEAKAIRFEREIAERHPSFRPAMESSITRVLRKEDSAHVAARATVRISTGSNEAVREAAAFVSQLKQNVHQQAFSNYERRAPYSMYGRSGPKRADLIMSSMRSTEHTYHVSKTNAIVTGETRQESLDRALGHDGSVVGKVFRAMKPESPIQRQFLANPLPAKSRMSSAIHLAAAEEGRLTGKMHQAESILQGRMKKTPYHAQTAIVDHHPIDVSIASTPRGGYFESGTESIANSLGSKKPYTPELMPSRRMVHYPESHPETFAHVSQKPIMYHPFSTSSTRQADRAKYHMMKAAKPSFGVARKEIMAPEVLRSSITTGDVIPQPMVAASQPAGQHQVLFRSMMDRANGAKDRYPGRQNKITMDALAMIGYQ